MLWVNQVYYRITFLAKAPPKRKAAPALLSNRHTDRKLTNKCGGGSEFVVVPNNVILSIVYLIVIGSHRFRSPLVVVLFNRYNFVYMKRAVRELRGGRLRQLWFRFNNSAVVDSLDDSNQPLSHPHHSISDTLLYRFSPFLCPFGVTFNIFSSCSCTEEETEGTRLEYIGLHNNHRQTKTNFISDFSQIHNTSTGWWSVGRMQLS